MNTTDVIIEELGKMGYDAKLTKVNKNGVPLTGLIVSDESAELAKPIIYAKDIAQYIVDTYKHVKDTLGFDDKIVEWEYAKDRLVLCLQKRTDEDILKRDFLDLEMYVRVVLSDKSSFDSYKVKPGLFTGVNEDEIFARALLNSKNNIVTDSMLEMMARMMGCTINDLDSANTDVPTQIVVMNKSKMFGAAAICDKDLLTKIAKEYDSNLAILPSSIHEIIILVDNDPDMEGLNDMVKSVNETTVSPEEVLSDHAYFFNKETCEITW